MGWPRVVQVRAGWPRRTTWCGHDSTGAVLRFSGASSQALPRLVIAVAMARTGVLQCIQRSVGDIVNA